MNKIITRKSLTLDDKCTRETGGKMSESFRGKEAVEGEDAQTVRSKVFLHEAVNS